MLRFSPDGWWRAGALLAAVLVLMSSAVGALGTAWLYRSEAEVARVRDLEVQLERLLTTAVDAETGQRGYVITGNEAYLAPYSSAVANLDKQLAAVGALVDGDASQRQRLATLADLLRAKRDELAAVIQIRRTQGDAAASAAVMSGEGKSLMDDARAVVTQMQQASNARLEARRIEARRVRDLSILAGMVTFLFAAVCLAVVFRASARVVKSRIDAAREIARNSAVLQTVFRNIADALFVVDSQGRLTLLNPAAERLCDAPAERALGRHIDMLLALTSLDAKPLANAAIAAMARGARVDETATVITQGEKRCIQQAAAPIFDTDDQCTGAVVVVHDVTDVIESERRLAESDRRKTEFISVLSHELRNPLAAVRSAVQTLTRPVSAERQAAMSAMADRQIRLMVRLVDDLLDVGRLERGSLQLRLTQTALNDVIDAALEVVQPQLQERRNKVTVDAASGCCVVFCDQPRLVQVMSNLITNASRYSPPGSEIHVAVRKLANDKVALEVRDFGIGIDASDMPGIFEMFSQVAHDPNQLREGLGVGLSLARKIVELHGGTLSAHSAGRGLGSTFRVCLNPMHDAGVPQRIDEPLPAVAVQRALSVLVVDDNTDAADALAAVLQSEAFDASVAYSGPAALELAERVRPDVMLLDIGMPGMDGYAVAEQLRVTDWGKRAIVIAVTGWGQPTDKERALSSGFDMHFTKPVDPAALGSAILAAFVSSARPRAAQEG